MLQRTVLFGIVLLAWGLRLYRIDAQSFWYDEGVSAAMTQRDVGAIVAAAAADIHPPLYYLALRAWASLAGTSELALRFVSAMAGLATVALLARLAARPFGPVAAAGAALLLALSPLHVLYGQEARMYSLVAALALASWLGFSMLLRSTDDQRTSGKRFGPWTLWLASSVGALYTQYFAALVVLAQNLVAIACRFPLGWRNGRLQVRWLRRWWAPWLAGQAMVGLLYAPWLVRAQDSIRSWPAISEPLSPTELGRRLMLAFAFGPAAQEVATVWTGLVAALLALGTAHALWALFRHRRSEVLVGLGVLYGPLALFWLLTLQRPSYNPKFLLLALPGFHLVLALGVSALMRALASHPLTRWAAGLVTLALLAALSLPMAQALHAYYTDPRYARDDYRGLVRWIEALSRPDDVIILNAPGQQEVFGHYYRGTAAVAPLPRQRPPDRSATEAELAALTNGRRAVWAVQWATQDSDPQKVIEGWLQRNLAPAGGRWFGGVYVSLYGVPPGTASAAGSETFRETAPRAEFAEGIRLERARLALSAMAREGVDLLSPGDLVRLDMEWSRQATARPLSVFVHIVGAEGLIWGQHDAVLRALPDVDHHAVLVPPGTPPGQYRLIVGIYDPATGQRLPVMAPPDGAPRDSLELAVLSIEAGPPLTPAASRPQRAQGVAVGPARLLGYDLGRAGDEAFRAQFHVGETAHLNLHWQALAAVPAGTRFEVELLDARGQVVASVPGPVLERYPPERWSEGQLVLDQRRWLMEALPGTYRLQVRAAPHGGAVTLTTVTVLPRAQVQ